MRMLFTRLLLPLPLMILLSAETHAQTRVGVGVGVGTGYYPYWGSGYGSFGRPGVGPYWGPGYGWPYYPGFGYMPNVYNGFYGNGLSMYGPPVPTHKPIPGVFGGGDSRFYAPPPLYGAPWMYVATIPLTRPRNLPHDVVSSPVTPSSEVGGAARPLELEVHLPIPSAKVFIDGSATTSTGAVRHYSTPALSAGETYNYEIRIEWEEEGLTKTHTKRVSGRAGERVLVQF